MRTSEEEKTKKIEIGRGISEFQFGVKRMIENIEVIMGRGTHMCLVLTSHVENAYSKYKF